ncbi:hypothetical protein Hanom_Chr15g01392551 [Helianthus anomalus]
MVVITGLFFVTMTTIQCRLKKIRRWCQDIGFRRCFLTVKRKWNWSKLGRCSTEQNHVAAVVTTSYNIGSCLL